MKGLFAQIIFVNISDRLARLTLLLTKKSWNYILR